MVPTKLVENAMRDALAADAGTLAPPALANRVYLVAAPFVPGRLTDVAGLTLATFAGSGHKVVGVGTQQAFYDPATDRNIVQLLEPAGGWHWQASLAPAAPEVIYGYVVTDNGATVTLGSDLLPAPVTIQAVGDAVDVGEIRIPIPVPLPVAA